MDYTGKLHTVKRSYNDIFLIYIIKLVNIFSTFPPFKPSSPNNIRQPIAKHGVAHLEVPSNTI